MLPRPALGKLPPVRWAALRTRAARAMVAAGLGSRASGNVIGLPALNSAKTRSLRAIRDLFVVVAALALVAAGERRLLPGVADVRRGRPVTALAAHRLEQWALRHRREPAGQAETRGVALLTVRIDVGLAGGERLPRLGVLEVPQAGC